MIGLPFFVVGEELEEYLDFVDENHHHHVRYDHIGRLLTSCYLKIGINKISFSKVCEFFVPIDC